MNINWGVVLGVSIPVITFCVLIPFIDKTNYHDYVGKTVVIRKDTLLIMDYDPHYHEYNLSNGAILSPKLVNKLIIK